MALKILNPGVQPLGQFDGLDADYLKVKGGEVLQLTSVSKYKSGADKAAKDSFDGYINKTGTPDYPFRPALALASGSSAPIFLADDGVAGYGTLFGTVVGGVAGQLSTGGAVLGPHTATGSGKLTAWDKPGLYAVSLDACDPQAADGLQPTNVAIGVGAALRFYTDSASSSGATKGFLTPRSSGADGLGGTVGSKVAGYFVEFATNGSLVNTPNYLVSALNSPSGTPAAAGQFAYAVFHFVGPQGA